MNAADYEKLYAAGCTFGPWVESGSHGWRKRDVYDKDGELYVVEHDRPHELRGPMQEPVYYTLGRRNTGGLWFAVTLILVLAALFLFVFGWMLPRLG